MNIFSANVDPLAKAISNLGSMAFTSAVKKQEFLRALGKDMYEADRTQSTTDLNKARTAKTALETQNLQKLSNLFSPEQYTPQELSNIGAGAMMGSHSLNDSLNAVDTQQTTAMKNELYKSGNPATKMTVAIGKQVNPYDVDSGFLINKMTGGVSQLPGYAQRSSGAVSGATTRAVRGSSAGIISPNELHTLFSTQQKVTDLYGNERFVNSRDPSQEEAFIRFCMSNNLPPTKENAYRFKAGTLQQEVSQSQASPLNKALTSGNLSQSVPPAAVAPDAAPLQENTPQALPQADIAGQLNKVLARYPAWKQKAISTLTQKVSMHEISDEELKEALNKVESAQNVDELGFSVADLKRAGLYAPKQEDMPTVTNKNIFGIEGF